VHPESLNVLIRPLTVGADAMNICPLQQDDSQNTDILSLSLTSDHLTKFSIEYELVATGLENANQNKTNSTIPPHLIWQTALVSGQLRRKTED